MKWSAFEQGCLSQRDGDITKALAVLTSAQSKRLIAKAVAQMPQVRKAMEKGIIALPLCTTNGYIIEELTGEKLPDLSAYCCGFISEWGGCARPLDPDEVTTEMYFRNGELHRVDFAEKSVADLAAEMDHDDILIKSGNALDPSGRVGILAASPDAGELAPYLSKVYTMGIQFIAPMTLNKTVPVSIELISSQLGISKLSEMVHGMKVGMVSLQGTTVTEVQAIQILTGADALPVAMNGLGTGEGCVTLLIQGTPDEVGTAWEIVQSLKREKSLREKHHSCSRCLHKSAGIQCGTKRVHARRR